MNDIAVMVDKDKKDLVDKLIDQWGEERPELDAKAMGVVGRILSLSHILEQRATACLKPYDLHYSDFDVLATLRRAGEPYSLTPKELMQSVLITSGAMTALLERLSKKELISRGVDKSDGRIRTAILTEKGKALVDEAVVKRFEEAKEAIGGLGDEEAQTLAKGLRHLNQTIDQSSH
ncbi:MAG: MarR family transcriptional regulator [Pseudomonadota bacterium]